MLRAFWGLIFAIAYVASTPLFSRTFPKIGYTFASFSRNDFTREKCEFAFKLYKSEGFSLIVLSPSYSQVERMGDYVFIHSTTQPNLTSARECMEAAANLGQQIMIKPHLDPDPIDRCLFDFDIANSNYYAAMIEPWLKVLQAYFERNGDAAPVEFFLGTELGISTKKHPTSWVTLLRKVKKFLHHYHLEKKILLTHDFFSDLPYKNGNNPILGEYISGLESVSISQYTPLNIFGTDANAVAKALDAYERDLRLFLRNIGVQKWEFFKINFGEFGIGTGGLANPWDFSKPHRDEAEARAGYEGLLQYLKNYKANSSTMDWAILWTIGVEYDIFGNHQWSATTRPVRLDVADEIAEYNRLNN